MRHCSPRPAPGNPLDVALSGPGGGQCGVERVPASRRAAGDEALEVSGALESNEACVRWPEAAAAEVERAQVVLEVDMKPLTSGDTGVLLGDGH